MVTHLSQVARTLTFLCEIPTGNKNEKQKHISYTPELAPPGLKEIYEEESRYHLSSTSSFIYSNLKIATASGGLQERTKQF
jgi:hypothetical protein